MYEGAIPPLSPPSGVAEKRSGLRRFGEHCLSEEVAVYLGASCAAAGVREHRRGPEGHARAEMVLGTFAETKVPRRAGAKPRHVGFLLPSIP